MALLTLRRIFAGVAVGSTILMTAGHADEAKVARIGVLVGAWSPWEGFLRDGLRELGYTEGKNIVIEWRRFAGGGEELRSLAADLARSKVDVIVADTTAAGRAALEATATSPVVFLSGDPVATGLAASLAKPGRNGTGVSVVSTELYPKRLEYLHLLAPRARRIAFLTNSSNPIAAPQLAALQKAAPMLGVQLVMLDARNESELGTVLRALLGGEAEGVIVSNDSVFRSNKSKIAQALRKTRLPAIYPYRAYLEDGVLMSFGPNLKVVGRKLAVYVDKILKGAKPADLPIEEMSTYELVINLRIARELGLKVPQELLFRADEVIR